MCSALLAITTKQTSWRKNSMCYEAILDLTTCLERLDDMMGIVGCGFWTYTRQLWVMSCTQSCPHLRKPAASLMAQEPTWSPPKDGSVRMSDLGLMCTGTSMWWWCRRGGSNPKPPQRFSKQAFHTKATGIRSLKIQNRKTERRFEGNSSF